MFKFLLVVLSLGKDKGLPREERFLCLGEGGVRLGEGMYA